MAKKRSTRGQKTSKTGTRWDEDELRKVFELYPSVRDAIHEHNPAIQSLGKKLGRTIRSVEAQLIMFRSLERGNYSWGRMNGLCKKIFDEAAQNQDEVGESKMSNKPIDKSSQAQKNEYAKDFGDFQNKLSFLLQRSFGGQNVAIAPGEEIEEFWPRGPAAMGANDVCQKLVEHLKNAEKSAAAEWVFLIGGAGNGKSYLANGVVKQSQCELSDSLDDKLAHRVYHYCTPKQRQFRVVNDATIPTHENASEDHGALCVDIAEAIDLKQDLLGCVNRGILIGERREHTESDCELGTKTTAIQDLVRWLINPQDAVTRDDGYSLQQGFSLAVTSLDKRESYYAKTQLRFKNTVVANIHLLNMDYASIFEPTGIKDNNAISWNSDGELQPLAEYKILRHKKDREKREKSPAFSVLYELVGRFADTKTDNALDPLKANVATLGCSVFLRGLVEILRASEIASGHRYTYRELWGLFCIALVGYVRPEFLAEGETAIAPDEWFEKQVSSSSDELFVFINGALQRTHMSLFRSEIPALKEWSDKIRFQPSFTSASRHVLSVDPALDVTPDWSGNVSEAMQTIAMSSDQAPSDFLKKNEDGFDGAWQPFDDKLEKLLLTKIRDRQIKDSDRRLLQAWYGKYLFRFCGILRATPAFSQTIEEWTKNWQLAFEDYAPTPRFQKGMRTLLAGESISTGQIALPMFASRTEPIRAGLGSAIAVSFKSDRLDEFKMEVRGDNLVISLQSQNGSTKHNNEVNVDFPLCRELICCSSGAIGFTDQSHITAPRVERMRAKLLSPESSGSGQLGGQPGVFLSGKFHAFEEPEN